MKLKPKSTTDLAKLTSRRTCKRNFSQDHASTVTEQTEDLVFIHIFSYLQEELLTGSCQRSYWTDGGSCLHPHLFVPARGTSHRFMPAELLNRRRISSSSTSFRTCKRNFSQDHASTVTEQTEDLVFIHIFSDLQEELLTGSCQHSYWTDGGSRLHPYPRNGLLLYKVPGVDFHMVCL